VNHKSNEGPHFVNFSSLLGPDIFLSTVFLNTLNLCSSLSAKDKVSHNTKQQEKLFFIV